MHRSLRQKKPIHAAASVSFCRANRSGISFCRVNGRYVLLAELGAKDVVSSTNLDVGGAHRRSSRGARGGEQ